MSKSECCSINTLAVYILKVSLFYFHAGDETYQDIFRDFSQMASNNPEKLNRFQQDSQKFWAFWGETLKFGELLMCTTKILHLFFFFLLL